ncbi:MAG: TadE/TadG family type IV pilus assembly protein [Hyalangium sp.]|uniref:TadE/TadG family type IV pilus assembly protein n=1 Tax=Hyalangium sp. TaxID=2028555 RepID=UPI00389A7CD8
MRPLAQRQYARRGAATVEFALIVPVLVMILFFSMYLTELVRAKLKVQEFARYVVFEMTSYTLSDFATAEHDKAFTDAKKEVMDEAVERFKDMDSVEPNAPQGTFVARYSDVAGTMQNKDIPLFEAGLVLGNDGNGFGSEVVSAVNVGANKLLNVWSFNTKGWVQSDVSMKFNNVLIPKSYLDEGGSGGFFTVDPTGNKDIRSLALKSRFSMYADPWNMEDGADATIRGRRAGAHREGPTDMPHGLYKQVDRMVFLGVRSKLAGAAGGVIGQFQDFLQKIFPAFVGTFVVSHNYTTSPGGDFSRECIGEDLGISSYPPEAEGGLNNLDKFSQLDWPRPKCFDTAPFRDQPYDKSQYIQIFKARGDFFMGCKNAEAADPSAPKSDEATRGDESKANAIDCE